MAAAHISGNKRRPKASSRHPGFPSIWLRPRLLLGLHAPPFRGTTLTELKFSPHFQVGALLSRPAARGCEFENIPHADDADACERQSNSGSDLRGRRGERAGEVEEVSGPKVARMYVCALPPCGCMGLVVVGDGGFADVEIWMMRECKSLQYAISTSWLHSTSGGPLARSVQQCLCPLPSASKLDGNRKSWGTRPMSQRRAASQSRRVAGQRMARADEGALGVYSVLYSTLPGLPEV